MSKTSSASLAVPKRPAGAQQTRSLRTEGVLLAAATRVLDRDGLDGATVPRIADEARLSPASIYRRFADKDDLLRAALLRSLETGEAAHLQVSAEHGKLADTVATLIGSLLKRYRDHPKLVGALHRMIEAAPHSPFAKDALERLAANAAHAAEALLLHRDSIRHPDAERAVRFAVLAATSAIELAALDQTSLWHVVLPLSDKAFAAELSRAMLAYLRRKR